MPRRARVQKRVILPDPIYGSVGLAKFVNCVMLAGKKSIAEKIVYDSFEKIRKSSRKEPLDVLREHVDLEIHRVARPEPITRLGCFRGGGLQVNEALFQQRLGLSARAPQNGREEDVEPLPRKRAHLLLADRLDT